MRKYLEDYLRGIASLHGKGDMEDFGPRDTINSVATTVQNEEDFDRLLDLSADHLALHATRARVISLDKQWTAMQWQLEEGEVVTVVYSFQRSGAASHRPGGAGEFEI